MTAPLDSQEPFPCFFFFTLFKYLFIYLFLAGLRLFFAVLQLSVVAENGPLFAAGHWLLIAVALPVAEHGL